MKNLIELVEIPATDFDRAVAFYQAVLERTPTVYGNGATEKMAFFGDCSAKPQMAVSWAVDFRPAKQGVLVSFSVECIEATLALVEANGGTVVRPRTKIEADGMGYFAHCSDSEGNTFGLYAER